MGNLNGHSLAGMSTSRERVENDYYATPPETTKAILEMELLEGSILEPCCGGGHISDVLYEYYPDSNIISYDLIDRGYERLNGVCDFLEYNAHKVDNVLTNPPFKLAKEFIEKALSITHKKVIIFAKIQLLESAKRKEMFKNTPLKTVYVFSERQNPWRNGSAVDEKGKPWASTMCFAWFVWEHGYEGEPIVRWI
jgi:predicted RNA methylase